MAEKHWEIASPDKEQAARISERLGVSALTGLMLAARGIQPEEAETFWRPALADLHDPYLFKDMERAVARVIEAVEKRQKVLIFGDYDVDGVSATVLLLQNLSLLGADVEYHVPNRLTEGYGLGLKRLEQASRQGISLVIAVDNGINAKDEIEYAGQVGMDVIVVDHHETRGDLPRALAVIDPKRPDSTYPFNKLAAVGVALKLVQAVKSGLGLKTDDHRDLELVALGTIADVVALMGENRVLVKEGLKRLNQPMSKGVLELIRICGGVNRDVNAGMVGFQIAPRLNAAGRLGHAHMAVEILLTDSQLLARKIAKQLDLENRKRRRIEETILQEAEQKLRAEFGGSQRVIVLAHDGWHPGVIGIVASRLVQIYHRPAVMISLDGDIGKGSARSISSFDICSALGECEEFLISFGGHKNAAGLKIRRDQLGHLKQVLEQIALQKLSDDDLIPRLHIDAVAALGDLSADFVQEVSAFAPYGHSNPAPVMASFGVELVGSIRVLKGEHLKFSVRQGRAVLPVIGFGMVHRADKIESSSFVDVAYAPQFNTWQGKTSIQLNLRDVRPAT